MKPAELQRLLEAVESLPKLLQEVEGIRLTLQDVQAKVTTAVSAVDTLVHSALLETLPVVCPTCRGAVKLCVAHQNNRLFWGCARYPSCKGGVDYLRWREEALALLKASSSE